jgi:hypothetical protein
MSPTWALLAYFGAIAVAIVLLWRFHSRSWYWHCASLILAFVLAYIPYPHLNFAGSPVIDLIMGFVILFLLTWGVGGLLSLGLHQPGHHRHA